MSQLPRPGQTVKVTFTGTVREVLDVGDFDAVYLENAVFFTDGTVIAAGDDGVALFEDVTPAFVPQSGDVATYLSGSGVPITIQYRRNFDVRDKATMSWFNEFGRVVNEPETDPSFRLVLRDGQIQEGAL